MAPWCQYSWIQFLFHFGRGRATSFAHGFGLLPTNHKAEIPHSFFSIHVQLTVRKIFVQSVLAKIFPKLQ